MVVRPFPESKSKTVIVINYSEVAKIKTDRFVGLLKKPQIEKTLNRLC
jgi:hypothetical protein